MTQTGRDPYPWTWEVPAAAMLGIGVVALSGIHLGRGVACLIGGAGFQWAAPESMLTAVAGILSGAAGAGLGEPVAGVTQAQLVGSILVVEVALLGLLAMLGYTAVQRWGPAALKGVASPAETRRLLGRGRLVRAAAIIRPDLYGKSCTVRRPRPATIRGHRPRAKSRPQTRGPIIRPQRNGRPYGTRPTRPSWPA